VSFVILLASLPLAAFAAIVVLAFRRVVAGSQLPVTVEWMETLSVERYRPMLRLLNEEDLSFLESQPGFNPAMAGRLRRQRFHIFRGYLQSLESDFQRICSATKLIMLNSQSDRPDLAATLIRAQAAFAWGLVEVEFRLALYRLGVASVDVTSLVKLFDGMQIELRNLVPASAEGMA
jgi:hypothetical protein